MEQRRRERIRGKDYSKQLKQLSAVCVCACVCVTCTPRSRQVQEIFGPVLAVYVHLEKEWESTLRLINDTSPYGLTGSMFACNRDIVQNRRAWQLRHQ